MTNSENSVEEEKTESQMLKEAMEKMEKMRLEMNEMQLALARVQKGPEPPVTPTLPPGHTPEYPPPNPSTSFPSHHYYQGRNAYDPQVPPLNQNLPPNVPVFVEPPPATLQRLSSEPLFQAHDNQYYPPEPTFKAPEPHAYNPHFEVPVEIEKSAKSPE
ncbi:extensin-like [Nicotiana sylvestris]|uniref:extensin-like n=1 Tax=Nicotiana sylvestris TaxID=4096 RepID=UPI00388CC328